MRHAMVAFAIADIANFRTNKQLLFTPHLALGGVVNNIMIGHAVTDTVQNNLSFHFPPLPEHSILFYPLDGPSTEDVITKQIRTLYACTVTGPQTERNILSLGHNHLMVKIGLQPGALYRLLGQPVHAMLPYKDYDGETIFSNQVSGVLDKLANAVTFEAMKNIADKFMISQLTRIRKPLAIDHVIPEIIKHGGTIKIDDLVKTAYMSNREFKRAFKESMVFGQYSTAGWFVLEKAWLLNENNPTMTWTQVAYECNYFDPMYLIRDFKVFAGTNPKEISVALKASLSYS